MELVKETFIGFLLGLAVYSAAIEIVGIFFSGDIIPYTIGLVIGVLAATLIFLHMAWTLNRAFDYPEDGATKYVRKQTFLRLLAMVLVMLVGLMVSGINFIALVLGLFGLKIGALIAPFFLKRLYPEHFVPDEETRSTVIEDDEESDEADESVKADITDKPDEAVKSDMTDKSDNK